MIAKKRAAPHKLRLNDRMVKRFKAKSHAYLVWDQLQRGLAVRIEPSGYRSWKVIYQFGRRPRWYHLAAVDAVGIADARKLAGKIMYQVAEGKDPQAERKAQRSAGTFEDLATRYLEEYAKKNNKSWQQGHKLVQRYLLPRWAKLQAGQFVRGDVKAMMSKITAPILANQVLAAASAIFTWAVREEVGGITANPCVGVLRNETKSRERVLSDSEIPQFWNAFDEYGLHGLALRMILLTGQRPGEVQHLRTEHLIDGWWELPGAPDKRLHWPGTKNGANHRVWQPAPAQQIITELGAEDGFVFSGARGKPIGTFDATMRDICKALGVPRATPHDLRRTHGTTITSLGFGREATNRIQNHLEGGIASVYDRYEYQAENIKIMSAVAAKFMTLIDGRPTNVVAFGNTG